MINVKSLCLFLLALESIFARPPGNCTGPTKKYYLSVDKANFFQAFINCKNGEMELAAAENEDESNALDAYLNPYKVEGFNNAFWLSGTSLNNPDSRVYYWLSTGRRAIFTKWIKGQNDNYLGAQHCMSWAMFLGEIGWADDNCEKPLRYVCEARL